MYDKRRVRVRLRSARKKKIKAKRKKVQWHDAKLTAQGEH